MSTPVCFCLSCQSWDFKNTVMLHQDQGQVLIGKRSPKLEARTANSDEIIDGPELVLKWWKLQVLLFEDSRREALAWLVLCWEHTIIAKLETLERLLPWDPTKSSSQCPRSGFVPKHPDSVQYLSCNGSIPTLARADGLRCLGAVEQDGVSAISSLCSFTSSTRRRAIHKQKSTTSQTSTSCLEIAC